MTEFLKNGGGKGERKDKAFNQKQLCRRMFILMKKLLLIYKINMETFQLFLLPQLHSDLGDRKL